MELILNIQNVSSVIELMPNSFSAHDFIKKYWLHFEAQYEDLLSSYGSQALRKANARIGRFLSLHQEELNISKSERRISENFHGNESDVQIWEKRPSTGNHNSNIIHRLLSLLILLLPFLAYADGNAESEYGPIAQYLVVDCSSFDNHMSGWEWLIFDPSISMTSSYPIEMKYWVYTSHPEYIIRYFSVYGSLCAVYDKDGTLLRIPYLIKYRFFSRFDEMNQNVYDVKERIKRKNENARIRTEKDYYNYCISLYEAMLKKITLPEGFALSTPVGSNEAYIVKVKMDKYGCVTSSNKELTPDDMSKIFGQGDILAVANADTSNISLYIKTVNANKSGKKKYVCINYRINQSAPYTEIQIKPSDVAFQGIYDPEYPNEVYKSCQKLLCAALIREAYNNNKYGIKNESKEVRRIIEDKFSIVVDESSLIADIYRIAGYRYREGMTIKQLINKMMTVDRMSEFAAKEEIRYALHRAYYEHFDITYEDEKTIAGQIVSRFVSQIKQEIADDLEPIAINRVNDISFDIVFPKERVIRVDYKQEGPFFCDFNVRIISI